MNHQYHNANFLVQKQLAFLQTEDKLSSQEFFDIINTIDTKYISTQLLKQINPNAIQQIVDIIVDKSKVTSDKTEQENF
jgi:UDP-N-acetylglucosamine:LPS N-acetylglucosamine transferase